MDFRLFGLDFEPFLLVASYCYLLACALSVIADPGDFPLSRCSSAYSVCHESVLIVADSRVIHDNVGAGMDGSYRTCLQRIWAVCPGEYSPHDEQDNFQAAVCELLEWVERSHCICSVPFIPVGLLQVRC